MIGKYINIKSGFAFDSNLFNSEGKGLPLIRIRDVGKNKSETYFSGSYSDDFIVRKGDLLVGMDGDFRISEWLGENSLLNQRVCKVIPKNDIIDKKYLLYALPKELKKIEDSTSFATVKHLSVKKINEIQIPLPPLEEQKRIAAILDAADLHRQKTKELIAKYDELAQALFLDMFGDPVTNPKGWEKVRLGKYCKIQGGNSFKSTDFTTSGVKLVKISNVHFEKLLWIDLEYLPFEYLEKYKEFSLNEGDILMALTRPIIQSMGTVKAVKVNKKDLPCLLNQRVARFFPNTDKVSKDYLLRIIYSDFFKNEISKLSSTSLQPNVSNRQVENIEILIPPITIQNDFLLKNTTIQNQKSHAEQNLLKAEELFQSLLQKAFKGEL